MTTRLRQRWLLAVLVAGQFMANVDIAIVNVPVGVVALAGAACSFLSARRRAAEVPATRGEERVPAWAR